MENDDVHTRILKVHKSTARSYDDDNRESYRHQRRWRHCQRHTAVWLPSICSCWSEHSAYEAFCRRCTRSRNNCFGNKINNLSDRKYVLGILCGYVTSAWVYVCSCRFIFQEFTRKSSDRRCECGTTIYDALSTKWKSNYDFRGIRKLHVTKLKWRPPHALVSIVWIGPHRVAMRVKISLNWIMVDREVWKIIPFWMGDHHRPMYSKWIGEFIWIRRRRKQRVTNSKWKSHVFVVLWETEKFFFLTTMALVALLDKGPKLCVSFRESTKDSLRLQTRRRRTPNSMESYGHCLCAAALISIILTDLNYAFESTRAKK